MTFQLYLNHYKTNNLMWQTLSDKTKALILALLIITGSVVAAWILSGWQLASLIAAVQLAVIFMAKHIWMSDKSNFLLRGGVLTIVSGVVLLGNAWWQPLVFNAIKQQFPNFPLPDYSISPITLLFLLGIVTVVFYFTRPESVIEKPEKKIADLIEGPTIKQKWESICESLSSSIRDIDRATNWSHEYYTPLDAEVEMKTSKRTNKVVKDLLEAIKESDDRLFLLVGDPGAGKSVALRKLCLDILKDSVKREYIPIYVNLKEWTDTKDWEKKPPTWEDLRDFIKQSLLQKDPYLADFFEKYYDVLDENGNLFFVLDSFDEIPQVLGTTADAKLIEDLSIVCREFLKGSKQKRSKGILASREYRMPRQEYLEANTKLTVRPFTFEKIEQSLTQSNRISKETVEKLLRQRPELVPSLRNPFISSLLKAYLTDNNNQFPKNQADLFENYIHKAIQKAQARKGLTDIPFDDILSVTIQIAKTIFSESGLQAPFSILRQQIAHPHFDNIVEIMRYTRIARGDSSNTSEFSFSHRRFYEYFVVQDLLKAGKADLPLENIPTDSRWRDTLVLYCEVASFEEAQRIANYCWFDVILPKNNIRDYASRHCLRFLTEAFRGRIECLVDFEYDLAVYLDNTIRNNKDMPDVKFASECIGILREDYLDIAATNALLYNNSWINDNIIRACRHLNTISENLENVLMNVIIPEIKDPFLELPSSYTKKFYMSESELMLSLSLSDAFNNIKQRLKWQIYSKKIDETVIFAALLFAIFLYFLPIPFETYISYKEGVPEDEKMSRVILIGFPTVLIAFLILRPLVRIIVKKIYFRNIVLKGYKEFTLINYLRKKRIYLLLSFVLILLLITSTKLKDSGSDYYVLPLGLLILIFVLPILMIIILLCKVIIIYFKSYITYKTIDKSRCNQREYIYEIFHKLLGGLFLPDRFISYLETEIKIVHGKYPDEKFLEVCNGEWYIRLAKLEERWREAEERATEQQNTPKPKPSPKAEKTIKDFVRGNTLEEAIVVAFKKPDLSKDDEKALILLQSRLAALEKEKNKGTIENTAYQARLTELKDSLLNLIDE